MGKACNSAVGAETPSVNIIVTIGDGLLYLLDQVKAVVARAAGDDESRLIPATCLNDLQDITGFAAADDVWSEQFLGAIILHANHSSPPDLGQETITRYLPEDTKLPGGPYILQSSTGRIFSVLRLFEDFNHAFVGGALPDGPSRYRWLQASSSHIPVPSRLYYEQPSSSSSGGGGGGDGGEKPLAGLRFAVKDTLDVAGLETGNGSKCYRAFFPPRESTAPCVGALVAAGAVLVGKLRCCQWCDGQDPLQRLEEVTPTNPRGDGFQKPSGSSSGSAAGCASYAWLDFTVGTDTGGSVRHPAGVNGLYGIRPSLGTMESLGLVSSPLMDTPGVFARSAGVAESVTRVMMGTATDDSAPPPPPTQPRKKARFQLLYAVEPLSTAGPGEPPTTTPKFFPRRATPGSEKKDTPAGAAIMERFVRDLEAFLGCARREISIFDLWRETHPGGMSADLAEATSPIYKNVVYGQLWRRVVGPFVRQYRRRHDGRPPFIEARTKARLEYGAGLSDAELAESVAAFDAYARWVNYYVLPLPAADPLGQTEEESGGEEDMTVGIPLLVYPLTWGRKPQYRDDDPGALPQQPSREELFWSGYSVFSLSYCSGCPDFTVPVGEVGFRSKITEREEYLPVTVSLLAPRGTDADLLELLTSLEHDGILKPVACGPRLYPSS
ncbi:amidase signature domain-containing protein [Xylariomycetidae sp. FL2044]|nr:amidase signature domain-containing protein [Xylariomycetidae sp. FL2044]